MAMCVVLCVFIVCVFVHHVNRKTRKDDQQKRVGFFRVVCSNNKAENIYTQSWGHISLCVDANENWMSGEKAARTASVIVWHIIRLNLSPLKPLNIWNSCKVRCAWCAPCAYCALIKGIRVILYALMKWTKEGIYLMNSAIILCEWCI